MNRRISRFLKFSSKNLDKTSIEQVLTKLDELEGGLRLKSVIGAKFKTGLNLIK
jgi:hypothetical protein